MVVSCRRRLASRAEVPIPQPALNLCSTSWYVMADVSRRFRRLATALQIKLTSPIPQKSLFPFIIRMTVCHVHSLTRVSSRNSVCIITTTFYQLVASGELSRFAAINHWRRFSALISDKPPKRIRISLRTAKAISSPSRMSLFTRKRRSPMRDCLSRRWNVPVDIHPFRRHCGDVHSGWGWGLVHCSPITSLHLYPCLSNKRWVGCKEKLRKGP